MVPAPQWLNCHSMIDDIVRPVPPAKTNTSTSYMAPRCHAVHTRASYRNIAELHLGEMKDKSVAETACCHSSEGGQVSIRAGLRLVSYSRKTYTATLLCSVACRRPPVGAGPVSRGKDLENLLKDLPAEGARGQIFFNPSRVVVAPR